MSKHWLLHPGVHSISCRVAKSVLRGSVSLISTSYGLTLNRPLIDLWLHTQQSITRLYLARCQKLHFSRRSVKHNGSHFHSLTNSIFCSHLTCTVPCRTTTMGRILTSSTKKNKSSLKQAWSPSSDQMPSRCSLKLTKPLCSCFPLCGRVYQRRTLNVTFIYVLFQATNC